ncbi:MAG TPA: hypothetical protein VFP93_04930, partial [Gammaproteobacteria bacterium]|nr:hypothetical protein [Gammaproteobacteria bacterium]
LYDLKLQNAHISFFSGLYLQGNVIEALASGNPITNALSTGLDDFKKAAQYYYHDKPIHAYEALFNGLKSIVMSAAPFAALLQAGLSNHQTMVAVLSLHVAIFLKWHNKLIDFKKIFTKDRQQTLYNYYLALMEGKLTKAERIAKELLTKHQLDVNDFSLLSEIEEVAITHVREQMLNILVRGLLNNIQKCQRSSAQNFATFDRSLRSAKYLKEQTKYIKRLQPFVDLTANNDAELDNLIKKTNKPAVQGLFQQLKHARHQSAITSLSQPTRFQVPHLKKQLANNKQIGKELNILLENYTYTSELYKDIYAVMSQLKQTDPFKFLSFQRKIAECDPLLSLKIFQNLTDQNSEMVYCNQDTLSTCLQQLDNYALLQDPFYEQECTQIFGQLLKQPHLQNAFKQSLMQASKTLQENLLGIAQKYKAKALYLCITDALNTSTSRAMAGCK